MDRRRFLKQVVATAMVGAVAPKLVTMGVDTATAGATSRDALLSLNLFSQRNLVPRAAYRNEAAIQRTIARLKGHNCP